MRAMTATLTDHHGHAADRAALAEARGRGHMPFPADPPPALWDIGRQRADMAAAGIARRLVSVPPILYGYELPAAAQAAHCRAQNDWIAGFAAPEEFEPVGIVPLGDPAAALAEFRRCREELGFAHFAIGSHVAGVELDQAIPDELWAAFSGLPGTVMLHPWQTRGGPAHGLHRLGNMLGNPFDTATAAARMIFAGVMERHRPMPVMLAHGGGALPGLLGRLDQGWRAARAHGPVEGPELAPSELARRFYYDTVVFSQEHLEFLARLVGADRILTGTDSPFDMGTVGTPPLALRSAQEPPVQATAQKGVKAR